MRDSDATLILRPECLDATDPGTDWTAECATRYAKPFLVCDPNAADTETTVRDWLVALEVGILNVAGPSEQSSPGIGQQVYALLRRVLEKSALDEHVAANAPQPAVDVHEHQPLWLATITYFVGSKEALARLVTLVVLLLIIFALLVTLAIKLFGFKVIAGKVYIGGTIAPLGAHATVDATAGFQNVGVHVYKNERVHIVPEGRIHTAMDHANNLASAVKGIIVHRSTGKTFSEDVLKRYSMPPLDETAVFYRDWCGPEGETFYSDLLEECKLRKELPWGALLVVVLPTPASARADPYEVLKAANLTPQALSPIASEQTFECDRDGWLTFIVNEAVMSPLSPSQDSKIYYHTLKDTAETLTGDPRHRIPLQSIPLIWFADNSGAFRLTITQVPGE